MFSKSVLCLSGYNRQRDDGFSSSGISADRIKVELSCNLLGWLIFHLRIHRLHKSAHSALECRPLDLGVTTGPPVKFDAVFLMVYDEVSSLEEGW